MKPWEEEWTTKGHVDEVRTWEVGAFGYARLQAKGEDYEVIARFASAAPDMARLLLEIEWTAPGDVGAVNACPFCDRWQRDGHAPDCALDAALRKAGVR